MKKAKVGSLRFLLFAICLFPFLLSCARAKEIVPQVPPALKERTTWLGLYLADAKIGWSRSTLERAPEGHYRLVQEQEMTIKALGTPQHMQMNLQIDFTETYAPLGYVFSLNMTNYKITGRGEVRDGTLYTQMASPQGESKQEIKLEGKDIYGLDILRHAAAGYKVGDVFEGEVFDPTGMIGVVPYRMDIVEKEIVRLGMNEEAVFTIKSTMSGVESVMWVTSDGDLIKLEGPMGITMKRETEESAKNPIDSSNVTDLILKFSVDAGTIVENPASLSKAVMEVQGLGSANYDGAAQTVSASAKDSGASGWRTVTVDLSAVQKPDPDFKKHLAPSPYIQSDDSRVIRKARELTAGLTTAREKVSKIHEWVHANVRKEPAFTLPSTVDVLATMAGDCNEHASLVAGLLRAAGVPTRIAAGLAYMSGRFYYHAWNESYVDGKWLPTDATFGELPASPLRIRLAVGDLDEQMKIAGHAGKIAIRIKETK